MCSAAVACRRPSRCCAGGTGMPAAAPGRPSMPTPPSSPPAPRSAASLARSCSAPAAAFWWRRCRWLGNSIVRRRQPMDFHFDASLDEFRREVRAFVADDLHTAEWQAILHRRGWSVPAWPVEHGGTGWSPLQQFVFNDECAALDAPVFPWGPRDMVGPILYTFGSEALKARFLPMIREGR